MKTKCSPTTGQNRPSTTSPVGTSQVMTQEQEAHLRAIKEQFFFEVDQKYRKGVAEHGGNLWELGALELIEEGMQEAVDQYVYLATARANLRAAEGRT